MPNFEELSWEEAMRRAHAVLLDSEHLYHDINASEDARTSTSRSTYDDQRSEPPMLEPGLPWPESLATKATAMATQAPTGCWVLG